MEAVVVGGETECFILQGVVTHHRGAYLNSLSNIIVWDMGHHSRYLWTLPMFHCNGWCVSTY